MSSNDAIANVIFITIVAQLWGFGCTSESTVVKCLLDTSLIQTNVGFVGRRIQTKVPVRAGPRRILATFVWIIWD